MKHLILCTLAIAAASDRTPPPKWQRPDAWNTQISVNMPQAKARLILGPPLLEYPHGNEVWWLYQSLPEIKPCRKTNSADNPIITRELILPTHGIVVLAKHYIKPEINAGGQTVWVVDKERKAQSYIVQKWMDPQWGAVAAGRPEAAPPEITEDPNAPAWQSPRAWQMLKKDMSPAQVERLLGIPAADDRSDKGTRHWYYTDIKGHGDLLFVVKKDRPEYTLLAWNPPYWPDIAEQRTKSKTVTP
jgi:outer membrane protein assembly factor BamE (lipoprotein component of BamABCDE complex)